MSSDFAPELQPHEYGPTPEDSMHRSLDDHLKHPASGEVAAVVDGTAPGVGAWQNHGDPRDEWPGAEDWALPHLAAILGDAEDEFWTAYHKVCTEQGEDAGDKIGTQYEAMARRILTGPELAARDADLTARAEARGAAAVLAAVEAVDAYEPAHDDWDRAYNKGRRDVLIAARDAAASYTRDGADGEAGA